MPTRKSVSGTWSAVEMTAKALGKAPKSTTAARMSQTWLASHTGPMADSMSARCSRLRGPDASRSHTPPPKSAPPSRK
jgi:hypothetical protein